MEKNYTRIAVLGARTVGKTTIIRSFLDNNFLEEYIPTIEERKETKINVNGKTYNLLLMDTAGCSEYSRLGLQYESYNGFVFCYSICSKESFNIIDSVLENITDQIGQFKCVLLGNKYDLEKEREVSTAEGKQLALKWNCPFIESSAKTGKNISSAFLKLLSEIEGKDLSEPTAKCIIL